MKIYIVLILIATVSSGCTVNNQNSLPNVTYLNVEQTFQNTITQSYDINNDGQQDWGFEMSGSCVNIRFCNTTCNYAYVQYMDTNQLVKPLTAGTPINSQSVFSYTLLSPSAEGNIYRGSSWCGVGSVPTSGNRHLAGAGDFYIGLRSQNPTMTNTYYLWVRVNVSADFKTFIVRDMAINTTNGGSISAGQH